MQPTLYRSSTPVVDTWYDPEGSKIFAEVIVDALGEATNTDVTEIPSLYETIDLEALSKLFDDSGVKDSIVSFSYENWNVFVRADGRVRVCDATQALEPEPVFQGAPS